MNDFVPLFKALADPARLRILNLLFESGELCVCDLESTLRFTQTKVSRHMSYLKRAGLVEDRKQGRWVLYAIVQPKTTEQSVIIKSIRNILQSHEQGIKDTAKLLEKVDQGCCATFVSVKPDQSPAKIHIK